MRDPKRIHEITKQLESIWSAFPDMRFHQLLSFVHRTSKEVIGTDDLFNVEDEEASRALDHILRNIE